MRGDVSLDNEVHVLYISTVLKLWNFVLRMHSVSVSLHMCMFILSAFQEKYFTYSMREDEVIRLVSVGVITLSQHQGVYFSSHFSMFFLFFIEEKDTFSF